MIRRTLTATIAGVVICGALAAAVPADPASLLFEAARQKATVEGDLPAAIAQYESFIKTYGQTHRALAAQALLRLAEAYARLGDPRARASYQRIAREYADQAAAVAEARSRLGSDDVTVRQVYTGSFSARVSPDGRYLAHDDWNVSSDVKLRDLRTGMEIAYDGGAFDVAFSPDSSQLAYSWYPRGGPPRSFEVRVAPVGMKAGTPRTVLTLDAYVGPTDWSPDGRYIAAYVQRQADRVLQLVVIDVSSGTFRVLKTVEWGGTIDARFSPDGRDIAFNARVIEDAGRSDIFLMATDASREVALVTGPGNDVVLGWTPDGTHLVFGQERDGKVSVGAQRVVDRRPVGAPTLLAADVGGGSAGMTRSGGIYLGVRKFTGTIEVVPVDLAAGRYAGPPTRPIRAVADIHSRPSWSPNGQQLAYLTRRGGERILGIRTLATGTERELHLGASLDLLESEISWAPDRAFVVYGRDLRGRYGVFRIDATDGRVTLLQARGPEGRAGVEGFFWSPDGAKMYYRAATGGRGPIVERDVATGTERTIIDGQFSRISLSPDGRWFGVLRGGALVLISSTGAGERELVSANASGIHQWTSDSQAIVAAVGADEATRAMWLFPIDGGAPRKLDMPTGTQFSPFSPDGRQRAVAVGEEVRQIIALENVLSKLGLTR